MAAVEGLADARGQLRRDTARGHRGRHSKRGADRHVTGIVDPVVGPRVGDGAGQRQQRDRQGGGFERRPGGEGESRCQRRL